MFNTTGSQAEKLYPMQLPKKKSATIFRFLFLKTLALFFLMPGSAKSQAFFNLTSTLCAGNTVNVIAQTGNLAANAFSWTSVSTGPLFSSPNATVSDISFPAAGTYTIQLDINDGTTTSTTTRTIVVYPLPVLSLYSSASPICVNSGATLTAGGASSYTWSPSGGLYFLSNLYDEAYATPAVTTGYTVTGTSSDGCQGSVTFTQVVNPYPYVVISANTSSVCPGYSATLLGLGAANYTWTGSSMASPLVQTTISAGPGSYSLVGAIGNCKDSTSFIIDLAAPLSLSLTASRSSICKDDNDSIIPVTLNVSGAPGYVWQPYLPGRMTYSVGPYTAVSPSISTCFTVTGTSQFCGGTAVICVDLITCTALEEKQKKIFLQVFPNPANDKIVLHSSLQGNAILKMISITGQVILEEKKEMQGEPQTLTIENLPAGIYFLSLEIKGQTTQLVRVVKQ
ncbi:hypothetical protein CNR22_15200 [Sphingobacteriaceae bacterium]|nr:hypothetical protein CNR22_15200 [Sphingobacteriaceae bacterium]